MLGWLVPPHKPRRSFTDANNMQWPGKIWVMDNDTKTVLQPLRGSSEEFVRLGSGWLSVLVVLCKVVTVRALT